jgi:hypothetical protein
MSGWDAVAGLRLGCGWMLVGCKWDAAVVRVGCG